MTTYRDEAIVLRTYKLGEADRIITMLTRTRGKVRAVGKGVRRTKSRFGARLEPAMQVDLQAYEGRNLDTVTQALSLATWGEKISRDYSAWTKAQVMLETADRLTEEGEAATAHYHLLAGGLAALAGRAHDSGLILDSYLLRALAIGGWAPSFVDCAVCGAAGPHRAFHVASGGVVCPSCRPPGSAAPPAATVELLAALLSGDWQRADASEEAHRNQASGLVAAYLTWHLERGVTSLRHVDRGDAVARTQVAPAGQPDVIE